MQQTRENETFVLIDKVKAISKKSGDPDRNADFVLVVYFTAPIKKWCKARNEKVDSNSNPLYLCYTNSKEPSIEEMFKRVDYLLSRTINLNYAILYYNVNCGGRLNFGITEEEEKIHNFEVARYNKKGSIIKCVEHHTILNLPRFEKIKVGEESLNHYFNSLMACKDLKLNEEKAKKIISHFRLNYYKAQPAIEINSKKSIHSIFIDLQELKQVFTSYLVENGISSGSDEANRIKQIYLKQKEAIELLNSFDNETPTQKPTPAPPQMKIEIKEQPKEQTKPEPREETHTPSKAQTLTEEEETILFWYNKSRTPAEISQKLRIPKAKVISFLSTQNQNN